MASLSNNEIELHEWPLQLQIPLFMEEDIYSDIWMEGCGREKNEYCVVLKKNPWKYISQIKKEKKGGGRKGEKKNLNNSQ